MLTIGWLEGPRTHGLRIPASLLQRVKDATHTAIGLDEIPLDTLGGSTAKVDKEEFW